MSNMPLLALSLFSIATLAFAAPQEESYLIRLHDAIAQTRAELPALTASAERAARAYTAGGNLYAAGTQEDFIGEACGRAGGLMTIVPLSSQTPTNHDVILYGVRGKLSVNEARRIDGWQRNGAEAVKFASSAGLFRERWPVDTVANVAALWAWTGEFVAACSRLGKMPVLYQSYGLPGGPERGKKYQGQRFHSDFIIKPVEAGCLGKAYLDQIERMLSEINQTQRPKIIQAARWWETIPGSSTLTLVTGHMFPAHGKDPRIPSVSRFLPVSAWENKDLLDTNALPSLVLYLGYQFAPHRLLEQAKDSAVKLVYFDVQPDQPPEPATNILYVRPGWPLPDACVEVPGYDIPILPASGVIQSAIFWDIAAERDKLSPF